MSIPSKHLSIFPIFARARLAPQPRPPARRFGPPLPGSRPWWYLATAILLCAAAPTPHAADDPDLHAMRTWRDIEGREIQARFLSHEYDTGTVSLFLPDGAKADLPLLRLSEADREFLASLAEKEGEEIIREWTSSDGTTIQARLVRHDEDAGTVTIRRDDRREFTLQTERLSDDDQAMLEARAAAIRERHKQMLAEAAALAGQSRRFETSTEETRSFHVYFPSTYSPDSPAPMLILFSPGGNGASMMNALREAGEEMGWIIVGCDGPRNGQAINIGSAMVADMLPEIERVAAFHDPGRLYTGGFSGGAIRAFHTVVEHERSWSGVLSLGGWMGRDPESFEIPEGLSVAWVNGDTDSNATHYVERDSRIIRKANGETRFFEFPGGHVIAPAETLVDVLRWFDERDDG